MDSIEELHACAACVGSISDPNVVHGIGDEIEAEIAEKYIELPVDADGVPIHVGDVLETSEYGKRFMCTGYSYQTAGYEKPRWSIAYCYDDYDGTTEFVSSHSCRHVGQDTIESLLEDVSKGVVGYPRERVAGYLEDNHPIGEAVLLDVRDRLRKIMQEVDA